MHNIMIHTDVDFVIQSISDHAEDEVFANAIKQGASLRSLLEKLFTEQQVVYAFDKLERDGYFFLQGGKYRVIMNRIMLSETAMYIIFIEIATNEENIAKNYLNNVLRFSPGFMYLKDTKSRYVMCNQNFAKAAGLSHPDEIIGKTDYQLAWGKTESDLFRKGDAEVLSGIKKINFEEPQLQADGKTRTVLANKIPLCDDNNEIIGILGNYVDITERKSAEEELKKAKEEAEASNKIKSEFISNMEHDIRTPFVGIYGMLDLLSKQESDPNKRDILADVALCAKELMDYCDGILDFSKIESESFPIVSKSFNLSKLVYGVVKIESIAAKNKKLDLSLEYSDELPLIMIGDPYRLKRILINLVSNAIKFTQAGFVRISLDLEKRLETNREIIVKIAVKDTGIGIPEDKKALIYERFTKLVSSNKGIYKGLGLGLRIVKQFITELDGDIHVKSKIGEGSTFILFLPFKIPLSPEVIDEE